MLNTFLCLIFHFYIKEICVSLYRPDYPAVKNFQILVGLQQHRILMTHIVEIQGPRWRVYLDLFSKIMEGGKRENIALKVSAFKEVIYFHLTG